MACPITGGHIKSTDRSLRPLLRHILWYNNARSRNLSALARSTSAYGRWQTWKNLISHVTTALIGDGRWAKTRAAANEYFWVYYSSEYISDYSSTHYFRMFFNTSCIASIAIVFGLSRLLAKELAPQESPDGYRKINLCAVMMYIAKPEFW